MRKFLIRTAKFLGVLVILLFVSAFIWANWEKPTPGGRAAVVDFVQYDAKKIGDSSKVVKLQESLSKIEGIHGTTYNSTSNLLVVSYGIDEINRETYETAVLQKFKVHLSEKKFTKSGPKCPIDVAYISRVKHFLCVRD